MTFLFGDRSVGVQLFSVALLFALAEVWTWMLDGFIPLFAGSHEEPGVLRKFNQAREAGVFVMSRQRGSLGHYSRSINKYWALHALACFQSR